MIKINFSAYFQATIKADREDKQRIAAVSNSFEIDFNERLKQFNFSLIWVLLKQHEQKRWNDLKQVMFQ